MAEEQPDAVLWMMAADSAITQPEALAAALADAVAAARAGRFVTFGMKPTAPETGYGYIEIGEALHEFAGVHQVARFIEKPDAAKAAAMVADGRHLWNSGMFVFTAATLLDEMHAYAPEVTAAVRRAIQNRSTDLDFVRLEKAVFRQQPQYQPRLRGRRAHPARRRGARRSRLVRRRKLERAVGTRREGWLWAMSASATCCWKAPTRCYARSDGMLTAVVGLTDIIVVTTKDAVLVMHRDRAQDVKKVVERLRRAGRHEAAAHNRMYRPWGFYESLINGDRFQGQAYRGEARRKAVVAKAFSSGGALGGGGRHRAGGAR